MAFTIYRITGPGLRGYVGCTSKTPEFRFYQQCVDAMKPWRVPKGSLCEAIREHGADAFEIDVVCQVASPKLAARVEAQLIARLGTAAPHGFNLLRGGGFPVAKFGDAA